MNELALPGPAEPTSRHHSERGGGRPAFMGFVRDDASLQVIRSALASAFPTGVPLQRVSFAETLDYLARVDTPRTVLIDISGEEQPMSAVHRLEPVIDPGTRVLIIGEERSIGFYRSLTRTLGVSEYLSKPLDAALVSRELAPWAVGEVPAIETSRGGSMVAVCGAAGGVGATTIATGLAWLIGGEIRRHTILLDADLQRGSAALASNAPPSTGLRNALDTPDRIDPLLIERAAQPSIGRLHVLGAEEPLTEPWEYHPGGGRALLNALRQRYNLVVADIPARPTGFAAELLALAHMRVIVTTGAPRSLGNAARWLALPPGQMQTSAPIVVLNRYQRKRCPPISTIAATLGTEIAVVVPELRTIVAKGSDLGEPPVARKGPFRKVLLDLAGRLGVGTAALAT